MNVMLRDYFKEIRQLSNLAFPIIVSQVGQIVIGVMDTVMLGHHSPAALAASGFALSIHLLFLYFSVGALSVIAPLISSSIGAGAVNECRIHLLRGIIFALVLFVTISIIQYLFLMNLENFGQDQAVVILSSQYFEILLWSMLPFVLFQVLRQFCNGLSSTAIPMYATLAGIIVNGIGNYLLIFGYAGFPELGVTGAGIATFIARTCSVVILLIFLLMRSEYLKFLPRFSDMKYITPGSLVPMVRTGFPVGFSFLSEMAAFSGATIMVGWIGITELSAHQIAFTIVSMTIIFPIAISNAGLIRVSYFLGESSTEKIVRTIISTFILTTMIMFCFVLIIIFGRYFIAGWFTLDEKVIQTGAMLLFVSAIFQIFDGLQVTGASLLRGLFDVKASMYVNFVSYWIIALPTGYILAFSYNYGAVGIWLGLMTGLFCAAVLLSLRVYMQVQGGRIAKAYKQLHLKVS